MNRLFLLSLLLLSSAFDNPRPVLPPPPTFTPHGAGAPEFVPPTLPPLNVPRSKFTRELPPMRQPGIYAAGPDHPKPRIRGLRPRSATRADVWEDCEKRVAAAALDPAAFSQDLVSKATRLTDSDWKCVQEHAMTACYLHLTAPSMDTRGLLVSAIEQEKFRDDMGLRKEQACKGENADRDVIVRAVIERGRLYDWKPASNSDNLNEAFLPPDMRTTSAFQANLAAHEQARKREVMRLRTITPSRTSAPLPDMAGRYMSLPKRALDACWSSAQVCLNNLGPDAERLPDPVYECLRWTAVRQCSYSAVAAHGAANMLVNPSAKVVKQQRALEEKWGTGWDHSVQMMAFGQEFLSEHCPKPWKTDWDKPFKRMYAECPGQFNALFK